MLYWAEGDKTRQSVRVANSDPALLRLFVRFLHECYGADVARLAVSCNLFADHIERQREIEDFWLDALDLPRSCLRKSIVNVYSKYSQKKRKNKLPYGTCKVVYNDTQTVPIHLRRDPGIRRLRPAGVARLVGELDALDRDRLARTVVGVALRL